MNAETTCLKIYFMRENHTFRRLEGEILEQAMEEFDAGDNHGMLCAVVGGKNLPDCLHAQGSNKRESFAAGAKKWLEELQTRYDK